MLHSAALLLAKRLNQHTNREGLDFLKLTLGIETFMINLSKLIVVYTLSAVLGIVLQTLTVHLGFLLIKRYSFGLHALNSTVCTVVSVCLFVVVPYVLSGLYITNDVLIPVSVCILFILYMYAPADTKRRPLFGKENRALLKKKAMVCGIILVCVALFIPNGHIKFLIMLGAVYQALMLLPVTYTILKRSGKNYEAYE